VAVFVLGAGATRGASFVDATENPCLPPLNTDFFTQLQRIQHSKHRDLVNAVIADTVDLFGVNFNVTMEAMFTTLEHTIKMVSATRETRDYKKADLQAKRDRLLQALAAVMEEALTKSGSTRAVHQCKWHQRLVKDILQAGDEILSFNYDCLIDYTLKNHGSGKWNPRYGYGLPLGARGAKLKGDERWRPTDLANKDETVHLYKLHGSLHFLVQRDGKVRLKERPYTKQHGNLRFTIIPPESHKPYEEKPFRGLWAKAAAAINRAQCLVLIGYSLPPTDLHATALFRTSVKKGSLRSLVIVNPDREARKRTRDVLQRGLTQKTRVLVFDELREFVSTDRRLWDA